MRAVDGLTDLGGVSEEGLPSESQFHSSSLPGQRVGQEWAKSGSSQCWAIGGSRLGQDWVKSAPRPPPSLETHFLRVLFQTPQQTSRIVHIKNV
jgi:hypothetical protein